jgi:tetratricopeptide (TPR) repeat protein
MKINYYIEKYYWHILAVIIIFTFIIGLLYVNQLSASIFSKPFTLDDALYDNWGLSISRGQLIGKDVFYGLPLYAYFLGFIYWLFGHSLYTVRIIQVLLTIFSCIMVYLIGSKTFTRKVGLLAALFFSLYGQFLFHEGQLVSVTLAIFLNLASILFIIVSLENKNKLCFIISGLLIGFSSLAMSGIFMIIPFISFMAFYFFKNKIEALLSIFLILFGISIPIGLSTLHNYLAEKDFVLVSAHGGITFYTGNNPNAKPYFSPIKEIDGSDIQSFITGSRNIAERDLGRILKPSEISSYWTKKAVKFILSNPLHYTGLLVHKFLFLYNGREVYDVFIDYNLMRQHTLILFVAFLNFFLILPLAILGIYISRKIEVKRFILYSYILSYSLSIILFMVNSRYRLPLIPALIIFSAYGLYRLIVELKNNKKIPIKYFLILLVSVIFTNLPLLKNAIGQAEDYNMIGLGYMKKGDLDKAIETLKKGIEFAPDYPSLYNSLGEAYYHKGQLGEAERTFKKAIEIRPDFPEAHNNLGVLYRKMNLTDNLRPNFSASYYNLGNAYLANKQYELAIKEYAACLEISEKPEYYNHLGIAYMCLGKNQKAIEAWRAAIKLDPQNETARENLKMYE